MPDDPRTTLKVPAVPSKALPTSSSPGGPEPTGGSSSPPSVAPDWYTDDVPTQRAIFTDIAPVIPSSPDRALLTVITGLNVGQVFTLDRDETLIGRGRDAAVHIDDVGISRRHARIVRTEGRRFVLEDLGSANGIFVNGRRVESENLSHGDRVGIGSAVVLRFGLTAADAEALARQLYEGATRDGLTRVFNRKYVTERLVAEVAFASRHATHLSAILFDLDHFKRINDTFGHQAGDAVLRIVAAQVQKAIRKEDILARYGGEEFIVVVRGIEHKNVRILADRIRRWVERLSIEWESRTLEVTVSMGVASLSECGQNPAEALVALADERLYQAKAAGRNRVR